MYVYLKNYLMIPLIKHGEQYNMQAGEKRKPNGRRSGSDRRKRDLPVNTERRNKKRRSRSERRNDS